MVASLVTVLAGAVHRFVPGWNGLPLIVACLLISLEAGFVHFTIIDSRMSLGELARYIAPELLIMAAVMRVAATTSLPQSDLVLAVQRWLADPLLAFDSVFVVYLVVGALIAAIVHRSMANLRALIPPPSQGLPEENAARYARVLAEDRDFAIRAITQRSIIGGALVLLGLGTEAVNPAAPTGGALPIGAASVVAALLYGTCALIFYSQVKLALLQARWQDEQATVADGLAGRWARSSIIAVGSILGASALLPRGYGYGLLDVLRAGLNTLGAALALVGYFLVWLFGVLLGIPLWLLAQLMPTSAGTSNRESAPPPAITAEPLASHQPQLLTGVIFWVCIGLLVALALREVLRRNPGVVTRLLKVLRLDRFAAWVVRTWRGTRSWLRLAAELAAERLPQTHDADDSLLSQVWHRAGSLQPRELVRFFYRSTLRRASRAGVGRRMAQTPNEYVRELGAQIPEQMDDLATLTDSFIQAHYGQRPVEAEAAEGARAPWQRLRARLRQLTSSLRTGGG